MNTTQWVNVLSIAVANRYKLHIVKGWISNKEINTIFNQFEPALIECTQEQLDKIKEELFNRFI